MSLSFPDTRTFSGFNAPTRFEGEIHHLLVAQGEVPRDLNGTFFRVQPDPVWPPLLGDDIPLNGDGLVSLFRFENGHVDFRSRYVRTEKFVAERAARRALFGAYRNPFTDDPAVRGKSRGTANTNVVWHGGRLLALKEDSHPVELDPVTLETRGPCNFDGALSSLTFTAHPKIDPRSGEMIAFGYAARGEATPDVAYVVIDANGRLVKEEWFEAPYASMVHDFGVTQDHVLFPVSPLTSDLERLKRGGPHFAWDGSRKTFMGVLPRSGKVSELRWFGGETCFSSHTMNAFADGSRLYYDTPVGDIVVFPFFPDITGQPWNPAKAAPHLERWTIDLNTADAFERRRLSDVVGEFPRIDERRAMQAYRHGWMAAQDESRIGAQHGTSLGGGMVLNSIAHVDVVSGQTALYFVGSGCSVQEPQFVPRAPDAAEGDGYVFAVVNRLDQMRSDLIILEALDVAAGPIATIELPIRLRNGLHGTWVDADTLARSGKA